MFKALFLSTIFATTFSLTPVLANDNVETDQKNMTPERKAEKTKEGQNTYIQGTEEGRTQGTEDSKRSNKNSGNDKNMTPAREANENDR